MAKAECIQLAKEIKAISVSETLERNSFLKGSPFEGDLEYIQEMLGCFLSHENGIDRYHINELNQIRNCLKSIRSKVTEADEVRGQEENKKKQYLSSYRDSFFGQGYPQLCLFVTFHDRIYDIAEKQSQLTRALEDVRKAEADARSVINGTKIEVEGIVATHKDLASTKRHANLYQAEAKRFKWASRAWKLAGFLSVGALGLFLWNQLVYIHSSEFQNLSMHLIFPYITIRLSIFFLGFWWTSYCFKQSNITKHNYVMLKRSQLGLNNLPVIRDMDLEKDYANTLIGAQFSAIYSDYDTGYIKGGSNELDSIINKVISALTKRS